MNREQFEKLHCGNNPHTTRRNEHGDYVLPSVQDAWAGFQTGWQAAQAAAVSEGWVEDAQDIASLALKKAWQLGQTYWQQADSEYTSHHRKADETQAKFQSLVEQTRAAIATAPKPTEDV